MPEAALFAYNTTLRTSRMLPGRPELFAMLQEQDVRPVVSLGAETAFDDDTVAAQELADAHDSETARPIGRLALRDEVRVIINRADKPLKMPGLPPVFNEKETRALGFRKWDCHTKVLEPLGVGIASQLVTATEDIDRFLETTTAEAMVVKPQSGEFGKGVHTVGREVLKQAFADNLEWQEGHLLQPAYDVTLPFPSSMQAYSVADQERYDSLNTAGTRKELRMYGFYSRGRTLTYPVARAFMGGEDEWFYVDPQSVPQEVQAGAEAVISKAAEVSDAQALYGTADYIYGTVADEPPAWKVVEANMRTPYLLGFDKHPAIARTLHQMFADQIGNTARAAT